MILITGGCGFIGSNFVLDWLALESEPVVVLDKLTYAGNINNLISIKNNPNFHFVKGDINDPELLNTLLAQYKPRAILNFAAESHVDRSIHYPEHFVQTNINGTFCLLEAARQYWLQLNSHEKSDFRFLQISTDEVYGTLGTLDPPFAETNAYRPNSPYAASKAAADHLVRAYYHTYGMPTLISNCSNNYGPYQFPEKLIPLMILNALENKPLPIYGDGMQVRDWLYVSDHCSALRTVLTKGEMGETYNIGGCSEKTNAEVVHIICHLLDQLQPSSQHASYLSLITHIEDRPGHDRRYAINANKIKHELGWEPQENFETGINKTLSWYLSHLDWVSAIKTNDHYQQWVAKNYTKVEIA